MASVVAVLISIYTLHIQRQEKKPKIEVEINISLLAFGPQASDPVVMLTAKNPGKQTVTLSMPGFLLPQDMNASLPYPQSNVNFPFELSPEKSCSVWIDIKKFARQLKSEGFYGKVTLIGYYRDLVGRTYKSKKWEFNTDMWVA
jgi:hypothetical protein